MEFLVRTENRLPPGTPDEARERLPSRSPLCPVASVPGADAGTVRGNVTKCVR